jgi:hypothetical protein
MGGERIKKFVVFSVLVLTLFALPAMATDKLFEIDDSAVSFGGLNVPTQFGTTSANVDLIDIGDQYAYTLGAFQKSFPFGEIPVATNALEIAKAQDSNDMSLLINIEAIEIGDQFATSMGSGVSTNFIAIETIQE